MARLTRDDITAKRFEIGELFTPSSPVRLADLFAGRIPQLRQLTDTVAEPGRHAILYGERGVGKTSLAQIVEYVIPREKRTIRFHRKPCTSVDSFQSIWSKFFRDIYFEVQTNGGSEIYSADEKYNGQIQPDDVIREIKNYNANDVPIFVIDEFNEIDNKETTNLMAHTIKSLSDESVNATIIIVGVGDDVNSLFQEHESIARCCEEVPMPRMSMEELGEIIDKRLSQIDMSIEGDARWKIIVLSRGLPMYVHRLGKGAALRAIENGRLRISEDDVDHAIEEMLQGSLQSLRDRYAKAVTSNQPGNLFSEVLLACALAKADDNGYFVPAAVREPLAKIVNRSVQIAQYQNHLNSFIADKRGSILQRIGTERSYRFRFKEPAMQPYVIMKGISSGMVSEDVKKILSFPEQSELFSSDN